MTNALAGNYELNSLDDIRTRLGELNIKAYYLLVALSFLCFHGSAPGVAIALSLKWALTLTSIAAVLPLQDFFRGNACWLCFVKWFKIFCLTIALGCTVWWIWCRLS